MKRTARNLDRLTSRTLQKDHTLLGIMRILKAMLILKTSSEESDAVSKIIKSNLCILKLRLMSDAYWGY